MRKSSPSFCQDTPDKESRCHWEVIMIVLTDGKDASIAYCLTTALYCPLPGQYLAIARHKTIRRERKSPLSFLLFTLHQIVWNPDKHWGSERWRVAHHSSPLFTHSSPFAGDPFYLFVLPNKSEWVPVVNINSVNSVSFCYHIKSQSDSIWASHSPSWLPWSICGLYFRQASVFREASQRICNRQASQRICNPL